MSAILSLPKMMQMMSLKTVKLLLICLPFQRSKKVIFIRADDVFLRIHDFVFRGGNSLVKVMVVIN